jgi:hypothetical protein
LLIMTALVAVAGVAGCQRATPQVAALPLDMRAAQPMGEAPAPGALPPAPAAQIAAPASYGDAYAYPDRAWGMSWAFGDSPPDYAFLDDGVRPWVWIADDDSERLAEPVPGGERYYYFEPGAYSPFYVQDPTFGYGFANGALVATYDRSGRETAPSANPAAAATAGQYLARGRTLRQEAASQPHKPVAAANWSARRGLVAAQVAELLRKATPIRAGAPTTTGTPPRSRPTSPARPPAARHGPRRLTPGSASHCAPSASDVSRSRSRRAGPPRRPGDRLPPPRHHAMPRCRLRSEDERPGPSARGVRLEPSGVACSPQRAPTAWPQAPMRLPRRRETPPMRRGGRG